MIMKERLYLTENEKVAQAAIGLGDHVKFNMQEHNIDNVISEEKANKFNMWIISFSLIYSGSFEVSNGDLGVMDKIIPGPLTSSVPKIILV